MAALQQQSRRGSQLLLLVAAVALVLLLVAGSADARNHDSCPKGYKDCDRKWYNKCETNVYKDPYNCYDCGHVCKVDKDYKYGEAYCSDGKCKSRCKDGWKYNSYKKYCYKKH